MVSSNLVVLGLRIPKRVNDTNSGALIAKGTLRQPVHDARRRYKPWVLY